MNPWKRVETEKPRQMEAVLTNLKTPMGHEYVVMFYRGNDIWEEADGWRWNTNEITILGWMSIPEDKES